MELLLSLLTKQEFKMLKELSPHALFVHCCCHVLQLASVLDANARPNVKHVYATQMTLWKFFITSKNMQSLKEIQKVLVQSSRL